MLHSFFLFFEHGTVFSFIEYNHDSDIDAIFNDFCITFDMIICS